MFTVGLMLLLGTPLGAQPPAAQSALIRGDYDRAVSLYERAVAQDPTPATVRGLARALSEVGRYAEAERVVEAHATRFAPHLWNTLGELRLQRGKLREAESAFNQALTEGATDSVMARFQRAALFYRRGALTRAMAEFDTFFDVYNRGRNLTSPERMAVALAMRYLSFDEPQRAKDALRAFDEAITADGNNLEARARLGELFLEKYNGTDALETFKAILQVNPKYPWALLGMARTKHFDGSDESLELVQQSLEVNPNLVEARAFLGALYLEMEDYDGAHREAERALETDPTSLDALSILAASYFFRGRRAEYDDTRRRTLALNPRYADLYNTLSELSARIRRYGDAVDFARQAVTIDSTSWRGYALLGRNQLRLGTMHDGARNLEKAFAGDPFDVWTKNTLDLLDTLTQYRETVSPRFRFVIDAKESDLLSIYAEVLAEDAYDKLAARYAYRAPTPVRVEIYPSHADFSVRTVGLVGLGALGVSFGPVVAMDSPSARDEGHFNWGSTLWHELAHTFHLGLSDHRVPRWLTEGLAVLEERRARPGWGDDVSPGFLVAFLQDRLVPVSDLNRGFTRPAYPQQIIYSYYQASLVCEMIEERHGVGAFRALLVGYRDGKTTAELFRSVLGTTPRRMDGEFDAYVRRRFGGALDALGPAAADDPERPPTPAALALRARRDPNDFVAHLVTGQELARQGDVAAAIPFLERAKELFPEYAGADSPYWFLAQIAKARGDFERAATELANLTAVNERHYDALLELGNLRRQLNDELGTIDALSRAVYLYPFDMELHTRLAELYAGRGRWAEAVTERRAVLALRPVDRADAIYQLALTYYRAGNILEARRYVLQALERAPNFAEAQELLLAIHEQHPRSDR